jgi:hypothetical protein
MNCCYCDIYVSIVSILYNPLRSADFVVYTGLDIFKFYVNESIF